MSEVHTAPLVRVESRGSASWLIMDSPHNRNALSDALVAQLRAALDVAGADETVRSVVLTHTAGTFCAGADLGEAASTGDEEVRERARQLADLLEAIVRLDKPVIGRIDGHVRAGGMGLVCACDLVAAGPRATFALTEVRLGLAASVVSLTVLPRLTGRTAAHLFLTGDTIDGPAAHAAGVVTRADAKPEDLDATVTSWVASFARCSPQGLRESKQLINHAVVQGFSTDRERLVEQSARLFASAEAREGMLAFLHKRAPRWAG